MRILSIIQPSEMGPDFRFEDDVWKVNFPAGLGEGGGVPLSTDANNAIGLGTDQGAFISTDLLGAYALTQDNGSKKINLYRFPAGTEFDPETATLVSSVNLIELSGIFDDVAIDGDVITFTDADTGLTLSIDTANLQKVSDIVGSDAINVISIDGVTTIEVRIDPDPNNLIRLSEGGLVVSPNDLGGGDFDLHQTLAPVENGLCHVVGSSHLVVPQIELVDVAGNSIGYINDLIGLPVSSTTEDDDHCPKWEAPTASNCRVGKVAVAFVEDLPYGNGDGDAIEWRIFLDGEDTGYIASASKLLPPPPQNQPMLMSVTQEDFGDPDSWEGKGYLEDILSEATNGVVSGNYNDVLTLLNETDKQVILTLAPSRPVSLEEISAAYDGTFGIFGLSIDEVTTIRNDGSLDGPPTKEMLEDYFDEGTGVLSICLAPNASGNGGSTSPQISCAGATDRFATSALWGDQYILKINGSQFVTNGRYDDIMQTMRDHGIRTEFNGEMETTYRNTTNQDIRIDLEVISTSSWNPQGIELDLSTNPTLMGHDLIEEMASFAFNDGMSEDEPKLYRRLTVCLSPAEDWMNWNYKDLDTSTAEVTLTNSVNLIDANQGFRFEGEPNITIDTDVNKWGDLIWIIRAEEPLRTDVTLTIDHPNYSDEYTCDFFARKPMVITLANTHEYARPIEVYNPFDGIAATIVSLEVVGKNGSTLISNPEEGLVIDAVFGTVRVDDLENGQFSYIVQGRFVDSEVSDVMKVKFVTDTDLEEVVTVDLTTNSNPDFQPVSTNANSRVLIGLVDNTDYNDIRDLPAIYIESPDWSSNTLERINRVGGEVSMDFDFSTASTYKLYIHAYLNGGELAILGNCVLGVDDWGDLEAGGYTFNRETYDARFEAYEIDFTNISKNNLAYVPKEGPSNLRNMTGMFAGTDLSYPSVDLSRYYVADVYSMQGVFAHSSFNGDIVNWDMRWVSMLDYAFYASQFRQDLSLWCVPNISQEPASFSHRSRLPTRYKPNWGSCPLPTATVVISGKNSVFNGSYGYQNTYFTNAGGNNSISKFTVTSSNPNIVKVSEINIPNGQYRIDALAAGSATINVLVNGLYVATKEITVNELPEPLIVTYSGNKAVSNRYGSGYPPQADVVIGASDTTANLWVDDRTDLRVDWGDGTIETKKVGDPLYHTYDEAVGKSEIKVQVLGAEPISEMTVAGAVDEIVQWYGAPVATMNLGGEYGYIRNQLVKVPDHIWPGAKSLNRTFYSQPDFNDSNIAKWDVSGITLVDLPIPEKFDYPLTSWNLANAKQPGGSAVDSYNLFFSAKRALSFNAPIWGVWDPTYTVPYDLYNGVETIVPEDYVNSVGIANAVTVTEDGQRIAYDDSVTFCIRSGLVDGVFTVYERYELTTTRDLLIEDGGWWKHPDFPSDKFSGEYIQAGGNHGTKVVKLVNLTGEIVEIYLKTNGSSGRPYPYPLSATNTIDRGGHYMYNSNYDHMARALFHPSQP